jgi:hypothetical protein
MNVAGSILRHKDIITITSKKELNILAEFTEQDIYTFIIKKEVILWKMLPNLKITSSKIPLEERISPSGKHRLSNTLIALRDDIKNVGINGR